MMNDTYTEKIISLYTSSFPFHVSTKSVNFNCGEARAWCEKNYPDRWAYFQSVTNTPINMFFFKEKEHATWFSLKWL